VAAAALALGCGSGSGGGDRHLIAALGDSITAGNPGYDPNPAARRAFHLGNDPQSQWEYWARRKYPDLEIRNCGVRSERTDEIVQRLEDCAIGADGIVIQGGINDLAQGVPLQATAANLSGMVKAAKGENLDVAIADVLPFNPGHPRSDRIIAAMNRRIEAIGRSEAVPVLPFHATLQDPSTPGTMKAQWTADGIHPSVEGYRRLGELAFRPPGD
jgi:acyl-CoA thioesterase I